MSADAVITPKECAEALTGAQARAAVHGFLAILDERQRSPVRLLTLLKQHVQAVENMAFGGVETAL